MKRAVVHEGRTVVHAAALMFSRGRASALMSSRGSAAALMGPRGRAAAQMLSGVRAVALMAPWGRAAALRGGLSRLDGTHSLHTPHRLAALSSKLARASTVALRLISRLPPLFTLASLLERVGPPTGGTG